MKPIPSDEEILLALRAGGQECNRCLQLLYKTHLPMVSHYIRQNAGREEDAQDKFQNAIVVFYEHVLEGRFEGRSSIKSYLYSIARHMWLNDLQRRGLGEKYAEKQMAEPEDLPPMPDQLFARQEHQQWLQGLVGQLGEGCRQLLHWRFWQHKPMREIAEAMGYKNEQVAKNKQHKCLESLRKMLQQDRTGQEIMEGYA